MVIKLVNLGGMILLSYLPTLCRMWVMPDSGDGSKARSGQQGSFWVWAQPIGDDVTMCCPFSLAVLMPRMIPEQQPQKGILHIPQIDMMYIDFHQEIVGLSGWLPHIHQQLSWDVIMTPFNSYNQDKAGNQLDNLTSYHHFRYIQ